MREKIEIPVNEALPMLAEMIKLKYVTDELGRSSGWIYQKMHYKQVKTRSKGFNESDISSLNEVLSGLGKNCCVRKYPSSLIGMMTRTQKGKPFRSS